MTLLGLEQHKLTDLHFCLYSRPVHPELFQIYAAEAYRGPAYEMDAWIIGTAHVISFRSRGSVLTELTTSDEHLLGRRRLLQRWRVRGERTCQQRVDGRIAYLASFQLEVLSDNLYRHVYRDLLAEGRRRGVLRQFEQWKTRGLTPFAYVNCEMCARELRVLAFHGFPEDHALVKTQSIFEC
ncbi:MAG: DUF2617 family protein [Phycisphaerae bacterium]|nr:DUF2617 family protein [Phycisphaerae bacterium]